MNKILISLLLSLLAVSCYNEDDASDIVIFVTPSTTTAKGGEKIYFDIEAKTIHEQLVSFKVETFDNINGESLLYSQQLSQNRFNYRYVYDVPNITTPSLDIEMVFSAEDNLGNVQRIKLDLHVESSDERLAELTSISLYSPFSGKEDAFSFKLKQRIKSSESSDADLDIVIIGDSTNYDKLSRKWGSRTDKRFCRANNFNYAAASKQSLEAVYNNSVTSATIDNIDIDDIILVGSQSGVIAVIKITNIYDEEGAEYDRYNINIKMPEVITEEIPEDSDEVVEE